MCRYCSLKRGAILDNAALIYKHYICDVRMNSIAESLCLHTLMINTFRLACHRVPLIPCLYGDAVSEVNLYA